MQFKPRLSRQSQASRPSSSHLSCFQYTSLNPRQFIRLEIRGRPASSRRTGALAIADAFLPSTLPRPHLRFFLPKTTQRTCVSFRSVVGYTINVPPLSLLSRVCRRLNSTPQSRNYSSRSHFLRQWPRPDKAREPLWTFWTQLATPCGS